MVRQTHVQHYTIVAFIVFIKSYLGIMLYIVLPSTHVYENSEQVFRASEIIIRILTDYRPQVLLHKKQQMDKSLNKMSCHRDHINVIFIYLW